MPRVRPSRSRTNRTPRGSRATCSRSMIDPACGDATATFEPITKSPRTPPGSPQRVEQVRRHCRPCGAGSTGSTPHARATCFAVRIHLDEAVAGELVGLLPVLATALAVALAGQAAVPRAGLADLPEREREVDEGEYGIDALALLLRPAAGEDHRRPGPGQPPRCLSKRGLGDAGEAARPCRVVVQHRATDGVEAGRPFADETRIEQLAPRSRRTAARWPARDRSPA